ncbi:hypothetical protein SAMN05421736_12365 [Evansella caseinilytica]|uniref:Uncharacterized protein n=1 Tax=Evansella caseinilytica TaxID=1503961 RepID=A0A1H3UMH1_9BACI|nr:hypothetical protein SAMN05421736_12365 [Evansella caseinilytica]
MTITVPFISQLWLTRSGYVKYVKKIGANALKIVLPVQQKAAVSETHVSLRLRSSSFNILNDWKL